MQGKKKKMLWDEVTFTKATDGMPTLDRCRRQTHTHTPTLINVDKHTLRSSASGFGCPSSNSLCLISSSSSFSLFLSRSSTSISFSRSLRRFCSALPLGAAPEMTTFRTMARAAELHLLEVGCGSNSITLIQFGKFLTIICGILQTSHICISEKLFICAHFIFCNNCSIFSYIILFTCNTWGHLGHHHSLQETLSAVCPLSPEETQEHKVKSYEYNTKHKRLHLDIH